MSTAYSTTIRPNTICWPTGKVAQKPMPTYYELWRQRMCTYSYVKKKGRRREVTGQCRDDNCPEALAEANLLRLCSSLYECHDYDTTRRRTLPEWRKEKDDDLQWQGLRAMVGCKHMCTYLIISFTKTINRWDERSMRWEINRWDERSMRGCRLFTTAPTINGYELEDNDKESDKEIKWQWSTADKNGKAGDRWLRINWRGGLDDMIESLQKDITSSYGHRHRQPPHLRY